MSQRYLVSNPSLDSVSCVYDGVVLDACVSTNMNQGHVAPYDSAEPHARTRSDRHISNDGCGRGNEDAFEVSVH